ncbi:ABC transporter substrate-binding protein [Actinophytocola oryzae]|uniref:Raffinose/stachyose/melibiose transport system substrate-binding protein n=1 Tax=Actinophytocola oryzae TaxID=502181 RepID=A0A4R7W065_9PSEU|nr:extracellular solute-binding protein [Actinophytocola oryzae]TDV55328.1 raffinose/stachyose/melibiose transport system substrate-binding protein [Actinophytocola oryzae]
MFKPGKALLAALLVGATALAGCGSDAADGNPNELRLWHYEGPDSAMGKAWDAAIKEFEKSHPGVKVKFEEKGFEQIQKSAQMVLNSDEAPDIMEYNKGNATAGLLSRQGLLTDMSSEVTKHGWDKLLSPSLQTTCKYDERGVMGGDKWFGVPNYAEYTMVYYNKNLFTQHGVAVPTTFDELVAAMEKFRQAGVTPLSLGGKEYPAQQLLYQLALSKADSKWVSSLQQYTGDVDFHDEAWTYAATTFADWVKKGYIAKDAAGIDAESMGVAFMDGKFPMMVSGSWWYGRVQSTVKDFEWDSFLFPDSDLALGSSGNLWVVPEKSKNKDLAYDFIDITMKKANQNLLGNSGGIPVAADASAITDPKSKTLIENYEKLVDRDGLGYYPDWPVPGYYDVLVSATQKLINGTASPDQALDELAGPYEENLANVGK